MIPNSHTEDLKNDTFESIGTNSWKCKNRKYDESKWLCLALLLNFLDDILLWLKTDKSWHLTVLIVF